ncbi:TolC family protein [Limnobacter sp.]|uniref:TolC family protein n=1 Tax=Limnobacter sp. TaxID=2003368 RepID=UPI002FE0D04E
MTVTSNNKKLALLACLWCAAAFPAHAQSIEQLLEQAIESSGEVAKARAGRNIADAELSISESAWLPQVNARLYNGVANTQQSNPLLNENTTRDTIQNNSISLQQSIYNRPAWLQIEQSRLAQSEAHSRELEATQNLIQKWVEKLMECKQSELVTTLAGQKLRSTALLHEQTQYGMGRGETSPLELSAAFSELELRQAELDEAQETLERHLWELSQLSGQPVSSLWLKKLEFKAPESTVVQNELEQAILSNNLNLKIQNTYIQNAELNIEKTQGEHHPTVMLVAQNTQSKSETVSTLGNQVKQNVLAIQVDIPLFSGFGTQAQVEKAAAALTQQRAELDSVQTDVLKEAFAAQKQLMISSNFARAYAKAISAAEQQEKAIETGIGHQLNSIIDLANIQAKQTELKLKKLERELKANQAYFSLLELTGELGVERVVDQITQGPN